MISVVQFGTLDYATALRLQQKLVGLRKDSRIGDVLLLLEHSPVITLGRNAKAANVIAPSDLLQQHGVEVFDCDRGGDVTFHGPGQLVGYPIFDLRGFPADDARRKTLGVIEYVRRLEEVLIRTCADFQIPAQRIPGLTGVWTSKDRGGPTGVPARPPEARPPQSGSPPSREQAKIAAIGVHISRSVTSHGFALNVNTDLSYFDLIVPCGIVDKPVTSIARELGDVVPLEQVAQSITRNFGSVFQSQILWVETLEALLGETVGVPVKQPPELRQLHRDEDTFWA
jgi:lipoyl(octanoyl) transferase